MIILLRSALISFLILLSSIAIAQTDQTVAGGTNIPTITFPLGCSYKWTNDKPTIGLSASGTGNIPSFNAVNNSGSPITATIVATPVIADYAYIPNRGSNNVSLINLATNRVEKTIAVGRAPAHVSVSPSGDEVYISNYDANSVSVISTISNTTVATIPVGRSPTEIFFSPDGSRAYVANFNETNTPNASTVSVINTATSSVVATIPTGENPQDVAVSPDGARLYVATGPFSGVIKIYDTSTNQFIREFNSRGASPCDMVFSQDGKKLYVLNSYSDNLGVVDLTSPIYATFTIPVGRVPIALVISPDGKRLYVTNAYDPNVSVIDLTTNTAVGTIPFGGPTSGIDITPDGSKLLVPSTSNNYLSVYNLTSNSLIQNIAVGNMPYAEGNFIKSGANASCTPITFKITVNPARPIINAINSSPAALTTTYGEASSSTSIIASGYGLSQGILVTPPIGFEVSLDNATFSPTVTLGSSGNIAPTTAYIRLKASAGVGNYVGSIVLSSPGVPSIIVVMSPSQVRPAALTISPTHQLKIYGSPLTTNTTNTTFIATGLKNGEVIGTTTLNYGSGGAPTTPVGTYNNEVSISNAAGGTFSAANYQITYSTANLIVIKAQLRIFAQNTTKVYGTTLSNSSLDAFTVAGLKNGETINTVNLTYGDGAAQGALAGYYPGSIIPSSASGNFNEDNYNISYIPADLTITPRQIVISAIATSKNPGENDPPFTYQITGDNLIAPDSFTGRLSRDAGEAPGTYTIRQGTLSAGANYSITYTPALLTIIATAKGTITITAGNYERTYGEANPPFSLHYSGFIGSDNESVLTALPLVTTTATTLSGVGTYPIEISGASANGYLINYNPGLLTITKAPLTITADNKQKSAGKENPLLTVTYSGFVNGDDKGKLSQLPQATSSATVQSPPGEYPIDVNGAEALNYSITYISGVLSIIPEINTTTIPNGFSPNGDGINDRWTLSFLQAYPQCKVQIFSRSGIEVFSSTGYETPWDGTYKGDYLPVGTYYYTVDLKNGKRGLSGSITIVR